MTQLERKHIIFLKFNSKTNIKQGKLHLEAKLTASGGKKNHRGRKVGPTSRICPHAL